VAIYLFDGDFGGERGGEEWEEVSAEGGRRREEGERREGSEEERRTGARDGIHTSTHLRWAADSYP